MDKVLIKHGYKKISILLRPDVIRLMQEIGKMNGKATTEYLYMTLGMYQSLVSILLNKLQEFGYLKAKRSGKYKHYSINYAEVYKVKRGLKEFNNPTNK